MAHEADIIALFNEDDDVEEFQGFPDTEIKEELEQNTLQQDKIQSANGFNDSDSCLSDLDSDDDELHAKILKRQKSQTEAKKDMLKQLMAKLNEDPVFLKMKTSSPRKKIPQKTYVSKPYYQTQQPPMTRRRLKQTEGEGLIEPIRDLPRPRFTVKFFPSTKRVRCSSTDSDLDSPKKRRISMTQPHVIIPVDEVTIEMLDNIAEHSVGKAYDPVQGTSCHQCRQKTLDTKSCCRYEKCVGVRGQFCGPCLLNRYGESVRDSLLDPNWKCPVCRGFCNCSICRNRQGKCATGILIGLARQRGHTNVKDFLAHLGDTEVEQ